MATDLQALVRLSRILGNDEARFWHLAARQQDALEYRWLKKLEKFWEQMNRSVLVHIETFGDVPADLPIDTFLAEHGYEIFSVSLRTSQKSLPKVRPVNLAKIDHRRGLGYIMKQWDLWRTRKIVPKYQQELADKIKKAYLKKVKSVWDKYSEDFRKGDVGTQQAVRDAILNQSKATFARAQTIIHTETTRGQNEARRAYYDATPSVTHYLYAAIRDFRTTKWCKAGRHSADKKFKEGGWGRDGLVFEKGTKLFEDNTPPCHWSCRSEVLPLTPANPNHKALIEDTKRRADTKDLVPLPIGWKS